MGKMKRPFRSPSRRMLAIGAVLGLSVGALSVGAQSLGKHLVAAAPAVTAAPVPAPAKPKKRKARQIYWPADKLAVREAQDALFGGRYVALGSSFAAGPGLHPGKPATATAPARCGQSMANYPTLLAEKLRMVLVDRTCSGARTENILGPWGEIPPQIDAVTADTRLVTLTIGGNDLTYVGNAFAASCRAALATDPVSVPGDKARVCPALVVPTEADYAADEARLKQIVREIRKRAAKAEVVFVQYLTLLPAEEKMCPAVAMSAEDAAVLRTIGQNLADLTLRAAASENARVVQMNEASASHTPCDKEPWLNGPLFGRQAVDGIGWHLTSAGMQATADGIAYWLTAPARRVFDPRFEPAVKPATEVTSALSVPAPVPVVSVPPVSVEPGTKSAQGAAAPGPGPVTTAAVARPR